jgi:glycine cleavage system H protein
VTGATDDLHYSQDHCWARLEDDGRVTIGLTEFAQAALGAIVFAALPPIGGPVGANETIGEVESTKAVSEVYSPIAGTVDGVNGALIERPSLLNSDPYGAGWFCTLWPVDPTDVGHLLDASQYSGLVDPSPDPEPSTKD